MPPTAPYRPVPAPGAPHSSRWPLIALAVAIPAAGVVGIIVGAAASSGRPAAIASPVVVVTTEYVPTPVPVAVEPAAPATSEKPPPPPAPTIQDGQWIVGEDFPAGTYDARPNDTNCYWDITKSGTNHSQFIDQQLGPGHYRVKLKVGQDFTTNNCGIWTKVG